MPHSSSHDIETGLYYLQSRYYSPIIGRYINSDAYVSTGTGLLGYNMYAYCNNNPVVYTDPTGHLPSVSKILAGVAIVAAIVAVAACVVAAPVVATVSGTYAAIAGVASIATAAASVAKTAAAAAVATAVVESKAKQHTKSYIVYTLSDPNTKEVTYVGRTSDYGKRMAAHSLNPARKNLEANIVYENLGYYQARAIEHALIIHYSTIDRSNKAKNQINGVNPKRKDYMSIMRNGFGISEAIDSILTNELLIFTE